MTEFADLRKERNRKAQRAGVWGVIYQFVYAVAQLVALGVLARYLDHQQFGLWMTVLALTTWMPLVSLGQSSVLLTKMGSIALNDTNAAQRIFTASTFLVSALTFALMVLLIVLGPYLPWAEMSNGKGVMTDAETGFLTVIVLVVSLLAIPAGLGATSVFATQRGDVVHIIMSASSLVCLGLVGIGVWLKAPLWLVGSFMISGPLLGGVYLWVYGLTIGAVPRPTWLAYDRWSALSVLKIGALFVAIDATTLLLIRTPDLIVAHLEGVSAVGPFASVGRLPLLMMALFHAVLLPFWPALGEAKARGDIDWIRRTTKYTLLLVLGLWASGALGIFTFGEFFLKYWMGSALFANPDLILAACAQSLGLGLFAWISILLSALSQQKRLIEIAGLTALVFLPLAFFFGDLYGPVGVALAQAAVLLFFAVPLGGVVLHRVTVKKIPAALLI